uniref:Uncharacterized protein n=1 Tax=Rhizophora mucronata TaxID=61149 RepID=A0A2P2N557_RHIMU
MNTSQAHYILTIIQKKKKDKNSKKNDHGWY